MSVNAKDAQMVVGVMLLVFSKNPCAKIVEREHMVRQHLVLMAMHRVQNALPANFQKWLVRFKSPQHVVNVPLVLRKKLKGKLFVCHAYPASNRIGQE